MIMHIVGNRPQLIKLAPLSRTLRKKGYEDIIIHTGQHYDENMSDIFFDELEIEKPYKNLQVGSGTHGHMTGVALIELEKIMTEIAPQIVIVYGDTNSTLAGALAAVKLDIPIVHVEAGPRTFVKNNPEEINRTLTDHVSKILCCPDKISVDNLNRENIYHGVYNTGDIMYDTFLYCKGKGNQKILCKYGVEENKYVLMTWHRQENTVSRQRMEGILDFVEKINETVLCPLHPRTRKMLEVFELKDRIKHIKNLKIIEPIGYMDMVVLMNYSKFILSDSGGVSKEAFFAGKKCLFMLDFNPWKELVENGNIITLDFNNDEDIDSKLKYFNSIENTAKAEQISYFGNGKTAEYIVKILEEEKLI
ncbi:non-hydrolyzing UDP-N-acetylglucosamine 2-epimerase [Anaerostipes sp.]|uniref:non-hydrolyzing UDP-N-acetylglucosamine 2-epimerase n=1 Tax=Anaerostipes sp. TaxID=1872530 RepID=UPI0025C65DB0|nr:UDP-N-acetylglucosamine 2-epimerase (non-hydrolyzing) [Anaerostipes sp.]MBS7007120.1 UDP-N-acetylglucosamine 2-epimerase (non-hydrolyzing) [Anaerostipes sp.]